MDNLDKLFRKKVTEMNTLPSEVKWRKENSWQKVQRKRNKYKLLAVLKYAAIIILLFSVSYNYLVPDSFNSNVAEEDLEYQKEKELLQEMNKRLGVRGEIIYLCDNCVDSDYYIEYKPYNNPQINQIY